MVVFRPSLQCRCVSRAVDPHRASHTATHSPVEMQYRLRDPAGRGRKSEMQLEAETVKVPPLASVGVLFTFPQPLAAGSRRAELG